MDRSIPSSAARLLDFIGGIEAHGNYRAIFGFQQDKLSKPVTSMTVDEVIAGKSMVDKRSSATGRYQFMRNTLKSLKADAHLTGSELMTPDLQDRLGFELLKRRGWEKFEAGKLGVTAFAKQLAMEWASLPVLRRTQGQKRIVERGQSFYAGDGLNHALVKPEQVEALLGVKLPTAKPLPNVISPVPIATDTPVVETAPVPTPAVEKRSWWRLLWKRDPAPPVAAPERPPGMAANGDLVVYKVQKALADLGYAEVGMTDGLRGPKLEAAIRAFRVENGLAAGADVDDALLAALAKAPKRQLATERVNATAHDLRAQGSQQIKLMDHVGGMAKFLGIGSVVGAIDQTGALDSAMQTVNSVRDTAETITKLVVGLLSAVQWCVQHWWVFGIGIAVVVIYKMTMAILNVVIAFRQGVLQRVRL